jgi:hypothetical protein
MAACTSRSLTISGVALALALAVPAAHAQEPASTGVDLAAMAGSVLMQGWMLGDGGLQFPNEMAVLSWNFQTVLVLWSGEYDPDDPYALHDPSDPATAQSERKCSFLQPQYCSSVQGLFDVQPPEPHISTTLAAIRDSGRRSPGRPATPDRSAPSEPTRTVNAQIGRVPIPGTRSPVLPDGEDPPAFPMLH